MQNSIRSYASRLIVPASISLAILVSGCGTFGDKDTDEAKKYEVAQAMDSGNYEKAIAMLEKNCAGYSYEECELNLGAAYLGKSDFDIISLGKDLVSAGNSDENGDNVIDEKDEELAVTSLLFKRLLDESLKDGTRHYKLLLPVNYDLQKCTATDDASYAALTTLKEKSRCHNSKNLCKAGADAYDTLNTNQKQACIAINPILLQEVMSDETDTSNNSVDLETILEFNDVVKAAIPGMDTSEVVAVVSGGTLSSQRDLNGNGTPDQLEVTNCVIEAYRGGSYNPAGICDGADQNLTFIDQVSGVDVNGSTYDWVKTRITNGVTDKFSVRLVKQIGSVYTTIIRTDNNITSAGVACANHLISDPTAADACFPEPEKDEDGEVKDFSTTAVDIFNNDALIESMAQMSDSSGDTDSTKFKNEVCYPDYASTGTSGTNLCSDDPDTDEVETDFITQQAILSYMSKEK